MRPGHWLPFGTLVLLLAGCSSRGGESLFSGEAPPIDFDETDAALDDEPGDDEADAGDDDELPDAGVESDAGEDATDGAIEEEAGPSDPPDMTISCGGDTTCTTPDQYCCRPPANINFPGVSASCKAADEDCRFGIGGLGTDGVPQHCGTHEQCGGGECCAIRAGRDRYDRIECVLKCEGDNVEVCNPDEPQCNNGGTCTESQIVRGLYVCRT